MLIVGRFDTDSCWAWSWNGQSTREASVINLGWCTSLSAKVVSSK